jgi:hypothetical protein
MSSNGSRRLEAWLVLAGMLAAVAWYARPQLEYSLVLFAFLAQLASGWGGG